MNDTQYISSIMLDEASIKCPTPELEHERKVAMDDLIDWNHFDVKDAVGPFAVKLATAGNRIAFTLTPTEGEPLTFTVPLAPFRSVIRDYFLICESYFEAVKTGNLPKIEAIDMSRRGLHNEGSDLLSTLIADRVHMDSETSRRLFTLICVLHLK